MNEDAPATHTVLDRERKKNEALAAKVFGKGRRNSAPGAAASVNRRGGGGQSLASRVGIQKVYFNLELRSKRLTIPRQHSASTVLPRQNRKSAGNVDVEWTHDLHSLNNPSASRVSQLSHQNSRAGRGQARNGQKLLSALNNSSSGNSQFNIVNKSRPSPGMSIRGLAGPYIVIARNFAPGTTAADIESAMAPHGGEIRSCKIISQSPTAAEIMFENKEGADMVIETFHNQTVSIMKFLLIYEANGVRRFPGRRSPSVGLLQAHYSLAVHVANNREASISTHCSPIATDRSTCRCQLGTLWW